MMQFMGASLCIKGKRLETLVDAFARFGVEQINLRPDKYVTSDSESIITEIEITKNSDHKLSRNEGE